MTSPETRPEMSPRADLLTQQDGIANVLQVIWCHASLCAWFCFGLVILPVEFFVPMSVFVSLVHQRAMSEWLHEGSHFNLIPNRPRNDAVTNALTGCWFGISVATYRRAHFPHHARREFFVTGDPDTNFLAVTSRRQLWSAVIRDLVGWTALQGFLRFDSNAVSGASRLPFLVLTAILHVALLIWLYSVGGLLAYAVYYGTLLTLYPLHNRLRVYGQHVTLVKDGASIFAHSETSRTIDAGRFDRLFWTSPRLLYHWEHHSHPHIPYRALAERCNRADDENRYSQRRWSLLRDLYRGIASD